MVMLHWLSMMADADALAQKQLDDEEAAQKQLDDEEAAQKQLDEAAAAAAVLAQEATDALKVAAEVLAPVNPAVKPSEGNVKTGEYGYFCTVLGYPLYHPYQSVLVKQGAEGAVKLEIDGWVTTQVEAGFMTKCADPA